MKISSLYLDTSVIRGCFGFATLLMLVACQNAGYSSSLPISISHRLSIDEFSLSSQSPADKTHGIRLVSVARDRTVTIELLDNHRRLSATPGQAFVSEEFGKSGLILKAASPSQQTATFSRFTCSTTVV